jgi:hypothetical protein
MRSKICIKPDYILKQGCGSRGTKTKEFRTIKRFIMKLKGKEIDSCNRKIMKTNLLDNVDLLSNRNVVRLQNIRNTLSRLIKWSKWIGDRDNIERSNPY